MLFKSAEIFFLSATLHMQKKVKEIANILTCFQALLKAQLFFLFIYVIKDNKEKRKTIVDTFYLFVFSLTSYS